MWSALLWWPVSGTPAATLAAAASPVATHAGVLECRPDSSPEQLARATGVGDWHGQPAWAAGMGGWRGRLARCAPGCTRRWKSCARERLRFVGPG
ncbi:hypothetical protein [Microtetraspora malaysiensis]|uniref:hypothetical protein n=1 Tax=Microtetraspora malaysiensis TaxID=161358 RepID=UPI003D8E37B7